MDGDSFIPPAPATVPPQGRVKLPNRRVQFVQVIEWNTQEWLVGVGFDVDGKACEIFLSRMSRYGTDLQFLADDACIGYSRALQHGDRVGDILDALNGRGGEIGGTHPPSLLHKAIAAAAAIERENGGLDRPAAMPRQELSEGGFGDAPPANPTAPITPVWTDKEYGGREP